MSDEESEFEKGWAERDSGPFCRHWGEPGSCEECAKYSCAEAFDLTAEEMEQAIAEFKERRDSK